MNSLDPSGRVFNPMRARVIPRPPDIRLPEASAIPGLVQSVTVEGDRVVILYLRDGRIESLTCEFDPVKPPLLTASVVPCSP